MLIELFKSQHISDDTNHALYSLKCGKCFVVFCHSCSCCEVTPSTIRQTSRRYAWWRRSSATWDTTSSRNRSLLWRPPYWWSPTRSVLCDTGRKFTNRFNTSLRSERVLTACGVKVSFSLRCSKVILQMLQYVRQKFFWLRFLVCGFTDFPLGRRSVLCFHGNMLFGLDLAAGKFFGLHLRPHSAGFWLAAGCVIKQSGLKGAAAALCKVPSLLWVCRHGCGVSFDFLSKPFL